MQFLLLLHLCLSQIISSMVVFLFILCTVLFCVFGIFRPFQLLFHNAQTIGDTLFRVLWYPLNNNSHILYFRFQFASRYRTFIRIIFRYFCCWCCYWCCCWCYCYGYFTLYCSRNYNISVCILIFFFFYSRFVSFFICSMCEFSCLHNCIC